MHHIIYCCPITPFPSLYVMLFCVGHIYIKSLSNLWKVGSQAGGWQDLLRCVTILTFLVIIVEIYTHISLLQISWQKTGPRRSGSVPPTLGTVLDQFWLRSFNFWSKNRTGLDPLTLWLSKVLWEFLISIDKPTTAAVSGLGLATALVWTVYFACSVVLTVDRSRGL